MRYWRHGLAVFAGALIAALGGVALYVLSLGPVPRGDRLDYSHVVLDREGRLLRAYADKDGRWRLPVTVDEIDPRFVDILLSYEDRRFHSHPGVDVFALGRAAVQLITHREIVSGGSTITMQVARLLEPRRERSVSAKLRQMVRAIELERVMTKREILSLYLSLAPYGGNLEGVRAAALAYFGREPSGSRSAKRRCLSHCRSHRNYDGRTAIQPWRKPRAIACSRARWRQALLRGRDYACGRGACANFPSTNAAVRAACIGCDCRRAAGRARSSAHHRSAPAEGAGDLGAGACASIGVGYVGRNRRRR